MKRNLCRPMAFARYRGITWIIRMKCRWTGTSAGWTMSQQNQSSGIFGGNSNWRGPVWFPLNYLLIESLQKFHHYYGEDFKVECPTYSKKEMDLWEVSAEISRRLTRIVFQG